MNKKGVTWLSVLVVPGLVVGVLGIILWLIIGGPGLIAFYDWVFSLKQPWSSVFWIVVGLMIFTIVVRKKGK